MQIYQNWVKTWECTKELCSEICLKKGHLILNVDLNNSFQTAEKLFPSFQLMSWPNMSKKPTCTSQTRGCTSPVFLKMSSKNIMRNIACASPACQNTPPVLSLGYKPKNFVQKFVF